MRFARLALIALIVSGCSSGTLMITSPTGGTHVTTPTIEVRGTAPANTEVVHDIPARPDHRTLSAADGTWRIEVDLDVGDNVLTFRLGDDETTAKQILVIRDR